MSIYEQCWESCFRAQATETYRPYLQEIYKSGNAIKRIKDVNGALDISFLVDSNIASFCSSHESDRRRSNLNDFFWDSESSESFETRGENATAIFQMQLQLAFILGTMATSNQISIVQFNENAAWGCQEATCVLPCSIPGFLMGNAFTPLQTNSSSCKNGLLEPACRVAVNNYLAVNATCGPAPYFAVAILNSNAHSHVRRRNFYRDYSPCHKFFNFRYAIGLHKAEHEDLVKFQNHDDDHNYLTDNIVMQTVVDNLYKCMVGSCCSPAPTAAPAFTTCRVAYGDAGETLRTITSIQPVG